MGQLYELANELTPRTFQRAKPGPVRRFNVRATREGMLTLEWQRTANADFYRLERTREGRVYEWLAETQGTCLMYRASALRDPWFYRVTAVNHRGVGGTRMVWFYERRGREGNCLMPVPVRPGLRVNISVLLSP